MASMAINLDKYIGRDWVEGTSHCLAICVEGLSDLGMYDAAVALESQDDEGWRPVDPPYRRGDVIVSAGDDVRKHVSLVYDGQGRRALSSCRKVGAFTCPVRSVKKVEGVYRYGPC